MFCLFSVLFCRSIKENTNGNCLAEIDDADQFRRIIPVAGDRGALIMTL